MNKKINWMITDNNITVNYDGQTHIVPRTDTLADRLIDAVRNQKFDEIPNLVSVSKRIETYSDGNFTVSNGQLFINGVKVNSLLSNKILKFYDDGLPYQPLVKFAERLAKNPSFRAVNELFSFLEKNDHPITEDGKFIAYKRVLSSFNDIYSNSISNSVGSVVEMPRNQVNEDANQTCSYGLHVANWSYAHTQYASSDPNSDLMLEVEVDPADVVAIPVDYNNSKMRVCKYKVLGVVDKEHSSDTKIRYTESVGSEVFDDEESEEEESEESETEDYELAEESDQDYPWEDEF